MSYWGLPANIYHDSGCTSDIPVFSGNELINIVLDISQFVHPVLNVETDAPYSSLSYTSMGVGGFSSLLGTGVRGCLAMPMIRGTLNV